MRRWLFWIIGCFLLVFSLHAQAPSPSPPDLEGDVINAATGTPIAGARVKLTQQNEPVYAKADEHGHFRFSNLEPGVYYLDARSRGFLAPPMRPVDLTVFREGQRCEPAGQLSPPAGPPQLVIARSAGADGAPHLKVTIPMVAYALVAGKVTDPYGAPMPDASVALLEKEPVTPDSSSYATPMPDGKNQLISRYQGRTNDRGEYRIANLAPGTYYVMVNSGGLVPWEGTYRTTYYPGTHSLADARPLVLGAGQRTRAELQIVQQAGVHLAGRFIKPVSPDYPADAIHTTVTLVPDKSGQFNSNGVYAWGLDDYEFKDLLPGKYTLVALAHDNYNPIDQKEVLGLVRTINVGEHDMDGVDLTLAPLRDVSGTVQFRDGCPASPVRISAVTSIPFGIGKAEAVAGPDGEFTLRGITAGRYHFTISPEPLPGPVPPVESITYGTSDVVKDGFESPYAGDGQLRIILGCRASGREL